MICKAMTRILYVDWKKFSRVRKIFHYVSVNAKTAHAPPGKPTGIWLLKNFGQIPRYVASLDGQMPHLL